MAQLCGYVAEHSAYHHDEMSLVQTIIGLTQNFVGSNNISLLMPIGKYFMSFFFFFFCRPPVFKNLPLRRNQGGKDHASASYILTNLSKVTHFLFQEPDDHL